MLLAVMHHPAMLIYLNNAQSVGPDSPAGQRTPSRPEREPRPRMHGAAHGQPGGRLHPGGRDQLRQDADRLVDRPALRPARLPLPPVHPRAGHPGHHGPPLSARRGGRRRGAAVPRQSPVDAPLPRHQAGAAFRRRRPAARRGAPYRGCVARHRRQSGCRGGVADHAGRRLAARAPSCATRRIT